MAGLTTRTLPPALDRLLRLDPPERLRRWVPEPIREVDPVAGLRVVLAVLQAGMTVENWRAWGSHPPVPALPVLGVLPSLPWNWLLLVSLVAVVFRPRWGIPLHVGVLVLSMLQDQIRLQPSWISLALLLVATGPWRFSRTLGWSHLATLWLWAGIMKALAPNFGTVTGDTVARQSGLAFMDPLVTYGLPVFEIAIGVLALRRVTREFAIGPAVALHVGAVWALDLSPENSIFWWNLALAAAAPILLRDHVVDEDPVRSDNPVQRGLRTMLVAGLCLYPVGVFTGQVDPYVGHVLYSGLPSNASVCDAEGRHCSAWAFNVMPNELDGIRLPPVDRLYRAWFDRACQPGQTLYMTGIHVRAPLDELPAAQPTLYRCPKG